MSVTVRAATADDASALHDVAAATFALACPPGTTQADINDFVSTHLSIERFAQYLSDADRELFVAVDGDFLGYTMLVYAEPSDADVAAALTVRPTVELSKVYVLPSQHGAGVSSALMAATMDAAHGRGVAAVWLGVNQENGRANRFYEKHGFQVVGTKKFLVGDQWHDDYTRERVF
ncbi:N-acetyltransferase [Glaciihabitans sp. UYNi722]|uniref:GNAT family N-acetyltransferase n=1 Tax=Glaciihabitans sp. UYNi722 TaxID=3156344 RepID=UPI003391EC1A